MKKQSLSLDSIIQRLDRHSQLTSDLVNLHLLHSIIHDLREYQNQAVDDSDYERGNRQEQELEAFQRRVRKREIAEL